MSYHLCARNAPPLSLRVKLGEVLATFLHSHQCEREFLTHPSLPLPPSRSVSRKSPVVSSSTTRPPLPLAPSPLPFSLLTSWYGNGLHLHGFQRRLQTGKLPYRPGENGGTWNKGGKGLPMVPQRAPWNSPTLVHKRRGSYPHLPIPSHPPPPTPRDREGNGQRRKRNGRIQDPGSGHHPLQRDGPGHSLAHPPPPPVQG